MDLPAPVTPTLVSHRRERRRFWLVVGVVLALIVLFEVGIRHVPPDGMTYTQYDIQNHWDQQGHELPSTTTATTTTFSGANAQPVIDAYYSALNNGRPANPTPGGGGCMTLGGETDFRFVFTWHGIPVQSWSGGPCPTFTPNSGGMPDIFTYRVLPNSLLLPPAR